MPAIGIRRGHADGGNADDDLRRGVNIGGRRRRRVNRRGVIRARPIHGIRRVFSPPLMMMMVAMPPIAVAVVVVMRVNACREYQGYQGKPRNAGEQRLGHGCKLHVGVRFNRGLKSLAFSGCLL
jgi:hypothetical protein